MYIKYRAKIKKYTLYYERNVKISTLIIRVLNSTKKLPVTLNGEAVKNPVNWTLKPQNTGSFALLRMTGLFTGSFALLRMTKNYLSF